MKPDEYLNLNGDFFHAIEGLDDDVGLGYLRAIWHYRSHNHCRGLENDSEMLRRICRIEKDRWEVAMGIIFDNHFFFVMDENGVWHQKRAESDWIEDSLAYQRRCSIGQKANKIRWSKKKSK